MIIKLKILDRHTIFLLYIRAIRCLHLSGAILRVISHREQEREFHTDGADIFALVKESEWAATNLDARQDNLRANIKMVAIDSDDANQQSAD